ncbi:major facilitator superfamily transporter [Ceratobasidium sp. AG-Ba]|nr:major facilitator superfamily transporter [Ceratobasidium sp. AG-Ba]
MSTPAITSEHAGATTAEPTAATTPQSSRVALAIEDQSHRLPFKKLLLVISSLCLCIFVSYLDQTSVSTVLPAIAHDLGAADRINWVGISFLVATTSSQIIIARLSDIFGRKALLISVTVLFTFGNLLSGFAKTAIWLFIARAIAGIGGGGINSLVNIIMSDVVSLRDRGKYQGFLAAACAVGSGIGPLIGGALSTAGWRWVFWFTVPITTACVIQLWWMLPQNKMSGGFVEKLRKVDFTGSILSLGAVVLVLVPLSGGGVYYSWNSALVITLLTIGSALTVVFILVEWRIAELPILPLYLFRVKNILIVSATTFLTGIVFFCNLYFLPSYYTDARGFTPTQAGIYLLPLVFIQIVSTIISGQLLSKTQYPRPYVIVGFALWTIGAGLQSMFDLDTGKGELVGYLLLEGIGIGLTFQTTLVAAQASAPPQERAVITGARNFFRSLGGAIGLNAVLKKELAKIPGLSSKAVAAIIKLGPQALEETAFDSAVRAAYMTSLHAIFILFVPIAGLSTIMSLFMKDVYLEGDKSVLPVAKTPTPPNSRENLELDNIQGSQTVGSPTVDPSMSAEKSTR